MIEIAAIGGYNEIGKNMTAVKIGDKVVMLDMGLHVSNFIRQQGREDVYATSAKQLIKNDIIPDDRAVKDWWKLTELIIPSHAHLDHVGATPFLADKYDAPIMGTPFTMEVLKSQLADNKVTLRNEMKVLNPNSTYTQSKGLQVEFIHTTHSTPQTAMVALHTPDGVVLYANDYKFDNYPVLGKKPNYERLRELGKAGKVLALIVDSTRAGEHHKTPSEEVAKAMLRDVMLGTESEGKAVVVSTFSSHIARMVSIADLGRKMGREVVFVGRSMEKYINAADAAGVVKLAENARVLAFGKQVQRFFRKMEADNSRGKYLFIATGHQGEPGAVLSRMADGKMDFRFRKDDHVIFSCTVIPDDVNKQNRKELERKLLKQRVRIFTDLHVSGHAAREDHRDLISMVKPKYIIPAHGSAPFRKNMASLAQEMGYPKERVLLMGNGQRKRLT